MGDEEVFLESGIDRISRTIFTDGFINSVCILARISDENKDEGIVLCFGMNIYIWIKNVCGMPTG